MKKIQVIREITVPMVGNYVQQYGTPLFDAWIKDGWEIKQTTLAPQSDGCVAVVALVEKETP